MNVGLKVYFYGDMDVALLKEVTVLNAFQYPAKWPEVETNTNKAIQKMRPGADQVLLQTCQDCVDLLLKHFNKKNNKMLSKSV